MPTISEAGIPGFAVLDWQGLFTTAKTPPEIVNKLNAEVVRILALPDVVEKLAAPAWKFKPARPRSGAISSNPKSPSGARSSKKPASKVE